MAAPKCPVCRASVRTENLARHLQSVHPREAKPDMVLKAEREATKTARRPPVAHFRSRIPAWVPIVVIVFAFVLVGAYLVATIPASPYNSNTPVTDMCIEHSPSLARHDHAQLTITILGGNSVIPQNVGISPNCMRPLHTHDTSGTIHIESPVPHEFTLADFFLVWGQPFSSSQILGYSTNYNHVITMTVNGAPSTAFETYVFPHDTSTIGAPTIVISYQAK